MLNLKEIEEDISEVEDNTIFDPDIEDTDMSTDGEEEAPEEQTPEETFKSKNVDLLWASSPQDRSGRKRVKNIIKMTPGLTRIIRFDNHDTRPVRWRNDKLAIIRDIWDRWVERLPLMYSPGPEVTVDERLVPFRGCCSFKVYIPNNLESREDFQEKTLLSRAGESFGDSSYSMPPACSQHTSCQSG
ncbi:piggyBac transposable element-derived protein 4-like [Xyrichtys novacula]|uniref:PiggyBac transposable element-derived protein 4-like n=1 Tax=Xyrichtys novacula TaxID=13765 RepID=A0AAV1ESQ3_XYRNO|nr:piggyBac transposable element-derived protein 4-like [Xyrichtys novacula]